jgi:hypothetical protein
MAKTTEHFEEVHLPQLLQTLVLAHSNGRGYHRRVNRIKQYYAEAARHGDEAATEVCFLLIAALQASGPQRQTAYAAVRRKLQRLKESAPP